MICLKCKTKTKQSPPTEEWINYDIFIKWNPIQQWKLMDYKFICQREWIFKMLSERGNFKKWHILWIIVKNSETPKPNHALLRDTFASGKIIRRSKRMITKFSPVWDGGQRRHLTGRNIWSFSGTGKNVFAQFRWWFQICLFYYHASQSSFLFHKIFWQYHLLCQSLIWFLLLLHITYQFSLLWISHSHYQVSLH